MTPRSFAIIAPGKGLISNDAELSKIANFIKMIGTLWVKWKNKLKK